MLGEKPQQTCGNILLILMPDEKKHGGVCIGKKAAMLPHNGTKCRALVYKVPLINVRQAHQASMAVLNQSPQDHKAEGQQTQIAICANVQQLLMTNTSWQQGGLG